MGLCFVPNNGEHDYIPIICFVINVYNYDKLAFNNN